MWIKSEKDTLVQDYLKFKSVRITENMIIEEYMWM